MNKKVINEYFINDMIDLVKSKKSQFEFEIKENIGEGTIKAIEILDGIFLSFNNYMSSMDVVDDGKSYYHKPVLIIHHCFYGGYRISLKNNLSAIVSSGESQFYAGEGEFTESSVDAEGCKTISIACYYDDFKSSLCKYLNFDCEILENYLHKLEYFGDLLVTKTNLKTLNILEEILSAIIDDDMTKIKIKSYELIYEDIMNYDQYVNRFKKLYSKEFLLKIKTIKIFLEENWKNKYSLDELSSMFAINKTYIKEGFTYMYQMGPSTYIRKYRLNKSRELLSKTDKPIIEIAAICGYSNPSKYSKMFKKEISLLPSKYRSLYKK